MRNIKLILEYAGTNYAGFQIQPDQPTIQGELESALRVLLKEKVKVIGAGRTDTGVHAICQVVNFKTSSFLDLYRFKWSANALLPGDIVIKKAEEVDLAFNARRDALSREYQYRILNRNHSSAFCKDYVHFVARPLNISAMQKTAKLLEGTHDFAAFCCHSGEQDSYRRTVTELSCNCKEGLIVIKIRANSFLHNMVRIIAGTLIEVGLDKLKPAQVREILAKRDRTKAGPTAPAKGLVLTGIDYP
jgi:tRNA pseudouridine38-40 synthase